MPATLIRAANRADLPRLTEIYNYYVVNTPITFDLEPFTAEGRAGWFDEHSTVGPHRLLVAEENAIVIGYASSGRFRAKPAYATTVESSVYCAPEGVGRGIGTTLYSALFEAIAGEDINRIVAGVVIPNDASIALHQRFGFRAIGTFTENGRKLGRYWDVVWFERPPKLK